MGCEEGGNETKSSQKKAGPGQCGMSGAGVESLDLARREKLEHPRPDEAGNHGTQCLRRVPCPGPRGERRPWVEGKPGAARW